MKRILLLIVLVFAFLPGAACSEAPKDYDEYQVIGSEVVLETFWRLFGGGAVADVVHSLGKPLKKTRYYRGEFWRWRFRQGVEGDVVYLDDYPSFFNYLYLSPDSLLRVRRKIGVGSPVSAVYQSYAKAINPDQSTDEMIVAGALSIGIIFMIESEKVHAIYIALGGFTRHGETLERQ